MLERSAPYHAAITGDVRRILLRAVIDIISPDIVYGTAGSSGEAAFSMPEQIHDKVFAAAPPYATLERGRWRLDGTFRLIPNSNDVITGQMGMVGNTLSGDDGLFSPPVWMEERFSNVSILQACSIFFSDAPWDGVPDTFTVEVKQGGTAYYVKTISGNTASKISLTGFTVNNPDAIRVTVSKWSLPGRRMRVTEILPGIYETWDNDVLASFNLVQQANFSCLAMPYGTCTLSMDNQDRRFEPRNKQGIFKSIEERQGIAISIGVQLADGTASYQPLGVFYQANGGWRTGDNGLSMQWDLVDIIGLLCSRTYIPPDQMPTTLGGWVASLAAQLGPNFANRYVVDPDYQDLPLALQASDDISNLNCGDLLRFICMATGTWARADNSTGYLAVEPYWNQGNHLTLDNLQSYPVLRANSDLAALIFILNDGSNTQLVVSGGSTASGNTVTVQNPFIRTQEAALTAARQILSTYGGNQLETTGRGDPSSEIGDVDTVDLDESSATTGRLMSQTFSFTDGVLQGCQSVLLQADGAFLYQERAVITASGSWTAPANVKNNRLRVLLVQGGSGGTSGTDGDWDAAGEDGADGAGGKGWSGTIEINPQQTFVAGIGTGGGLGQEGGETTFGQYSSAQGKRYSPAYTDVASGDAYGRTGVSTPLAGSGDGGAKGLGGNKGERHRETTYGPDGKPNGSHLVVDCEPGKGTLGKPGASGVIVIWWDKAD